MTQRPDHPIGADPQPPNRVPQATLAFWSVKLLVVTVGETLVDRLADDLGLGLIATLLLMVGGFILFLLLQLQQKRYVPWTYWLVVIFASIVGTLLADDLKDRFGVPLLDMAIFFSCLLGATLAIWFVIEHSLSLRRITTLRRAVFYWLAVLFSFALGTALGDLVAEAFDLGFLSSGLLFGLMTITVGVGAFWLGFDPVAGFWIAFVLTGPLGASLGALLSEPRGSGGLGLGAIVTSTAFLAVIVLLVVGMTLRSDRGHRTIA